MIYSGHVASHFHFENQDYSLIIPVAWPGNLGVLVPHTEAESYLQVPL